MLMNGAHTFPASVRRPKQGAQCGSPKVRSTSTRRRRSAAGGHPLAIERREGRQTQSVSFASPRWGQDLPPAGVTVFQLALFVKLFMFKVYFVLVSAKQRLGSAHESRRRKW